MDCRQLVQYYGGIGLVQPVGTLQVPYYLLLPVWKARPINYLHRLIYWWLPKSGLKRLLII